MGGRRGELYQPLGQLVVRAPLLPVRHYVTLTTPVAPDDLDPLARTAISVASRSLTDAIDRRPRDRKADNALRSSLLRYLIRMSTRPTPFGLFGGVAIGQWGERTDLRIAAGARPTRTRLDTGWLIGLALAAEQDPAVRAELHLVANTCVFHRDGRLYLSDRAVCGHPGAPDVSVKAGPVVLMALELARSPISHPDLVAKLAAASGAAEDRAAGLVAQLCEQDLLLATLRPPLTADPADHVVTRLAGTAVDDVAARLAAAIDRAGRLDERPMSHDDLTALRAQVRAVAPTYDGDGDLDVVQVDSALPLQADTISAEVAADAVLAVDTLLRLHPAPGGPAHLASYRATFLARYGELRTVPLLELLDPRFGLGPPVAGHANTTTDRSSAERRSARLLDLAHAALANAGREVQLDSTDLDTLALWSPDSASLPASLELSTFVAAASPAAVDRGEYRLVVGPNLGGQAAGRGLARFADLLDDSGTALLQRIAAAEARLRGGGLSAELVYLPAKYRSANVVVRPAIHDHEIPVGVSPGVPQDHVIPPDELAVMVRDGRLRLWWTTRNVEVTVAAGHMLNAMGAPALCRFLHEIGQDGITSLTPFNWGPAAGLPMLPRVGVGRVVLCPAQWRLPRVKARQALRVDQPAAFTAALADWRATWHVPARVYLAVADNRLLIDLDDPAQAGQLRQELRRDSRNDSRNDVVLHEALPGPDDAWLPGPGGGYLSELVIPLVRRKPDLRSDAATAPRPARRLSIPDRTDRLRPPGSDWLHLSLYGQKAGQDTLIAGQLQQFARDLVSANTADSWFFLRYADPDPHVRLRLHGRPDTLTHRVLPLAAAWAAGLVDTGVLNRVTVDTYDRELARYGGPDGTDLAEAIFAADSAACAALLRIGGPHAPDRLDLATLGVDDLLASFGLDPAARLAWYAAAAPPPTVSSAAYRARAGRLRALLANDDTALGRWHHPITVILTTRRAALVPLTAALTRHGATDPAVPAIPTLARSFTHLSCNRLGIDPTTERLVLGLLRRTLASLAAAPHQRAER